MRRCYIRDLGGSKGFAAKVKTTHGSGWIVNVLDLKPPPTTVGGIFDSCTKALCSSDGRPRAVPDSVDKQMARLLPPAVADRGCAQCAAKPQCLVYALVTIFHSYAS